LPRRSIGPFAAVRRAACHAGPPPPPAADALADLAARAALALVTNGLAEVQRGRLDRSGLAPLFRAVVISGEVGIAKPDPRFFQLAIRALGLGADEVLVVGDVPVTDIRGARAAGMASCWVAAPGASWPAGEPGPDYTIRDLRALAALAPERAPRFP
jgi:HAD superfamily hydrolase (TIGR01509 family)